MTHSARKWTERTNPSDIPFTYEMYRAGYNASFADQNHDCDPFRELGNLKVVRTLADANKIIDESLRRMDDGSRGNKNATGEIALSYERFQEAMNAEAARWQTTKIARG